MRDLVKDYDIDHDRLTEWRRDIHAHPEIGFEETRTADKVAELLESWGIEHHRGIGGTGIVGVIRGRTEDGPRIGLRAELDALPMTQDSEVGWKSTIPNRFHGCGHDGHMAILLGAARHLAETRDFDGVVHLILQPAEEILTGAPAMLDDGLLERFPCDEFYALHNHPGVPAGLVMSLPGILMAGSRTLDVKITGTGSHAAEPHNSTDTVVVAGQLITALQTIVARSLDPPGRASCRSARWRPTRRIT